MPLKLFNTLGRKKQIFKPAKSNFVSYYTCGPTVYQRAHIGNFRNYINEDILKRTLLLNNYRVKHIMNITDVGHLQHDSDTGKDKVEEEARLQKKSAWDIARKYEDLFRTDIKKLNILPANKFSRATDHIKEQIDIIKKLEKKRLTYRTSDGIYFDTSKFKKYGVLVKEKLAGLKSGARTEERQKKHPTDFALWKFSEKEGVREMEWSSPWGVGFPGWHIECSAMSMKYLGETLDIHAGGVDLIHPHHTNEIAQSEVATGKQFVKYWMHSEHLLLKEGKMAKSEGNGISLDDIEAESFAPLDFRYLALIAHYRSPLTFSWEALEAARNARLKLEDRVREVFAFQKTKRTGADITKLAAFKKKFIDFLNDDLNMPRALALVWKELFDIKSSAIAHDAFLFADHALGLNLKNLRPVSVPTNIFSLLEKREEARRVKDWDRADKIRKEIESLGFLVEDTAEGARVKGK